jgi:hypothetical protein
MGTKTKPASQTLGVGAGIRRAINAVAVITVVAETLAAPPAAAQAYNALCQEDRQRQHNALIKRIGSLDPARHGTLLREITRSEEFIQKGEEFNKTYDQVVNSVSQQKWREIEATLAYQQAVQELDRRTQYTAPGVQRQVREWAQATESVNREFGKRHRIGLVKDPTVDAQNAEGNRLQRDSNFHEKKLYAQQTAVDVGTAERERNVAQTVTKFARDLDFNPADVARLQDSKAWGQLAGAYEMFVGLSESGAFDAKTGYAMQRDFWESNAGGAIGGAQAAQEIGWMTVQGVTANHGGSPDAAEIRRNLGPKTAASLAELGARGASNVDRAGIVRRQLKEAFIKHGLKPAEETPAKSRPEVKEVPLPEYVQAQKIAKEKGVSGLMSTISEAVTEVKKKTAPLKHIFISDD